MTELVPNRTCGSCTACCQYLTIDAPELQVMPGVLCSNCELHKGCTIYGARPQVCRDHMCGWRLFAIFDDEWRPDKIGVLVSVVNGLSPEDYSQEGLDLLLTHPEIALRAAPFTKFLIRAISARVPLFLSILHSQGNLPTRIFINPYLEEAAAQRDEQGTLTIVKAALSSLAKMEAKPVVFKYKTGT